MQGGLYAVREVSKRPHFRTPQSAKTIMKIEIAGVSKTRHAATHYEDSILMKASLQSARCLSLKDQPFTSLVAILALQQKFCSFGEYYA